jgi:hypothetical protein
MRNSSVLSLDGKLNLDVQLVGSQQGCANPTS